MAEKLADFKISVDIEKKDDLLLFGDAIGNIEKRVWTTSEAMIYLKAQVEEYQNKVDKAKVGTQEWQDANQKLKASQEELAHALSSEGRREITVARQEAKKLAESEREAARAAKELERDTKAAGKAASQSSREYEKFARKAVTFLGQYLAIKKTFSAVMGFAAEGEQLARMAQLSGTSAEAIEKLGIALKNYGGSASSASSVLGKLNKQMEDLKFGKGGKLGQAAIRYDLDISAKTPEDMLRNIAKRMEGMGALQQVNMGRMLGLDDSTIMFLQQGLEGVNRELEKAGSLTVFSKEDIENSKKMQRSYREFQERLEQLKATMTRDLLPVFQTLFERLGKLADYLKEHPKLLKALGVAAAVAFGVLSFWLSPVLFTLGAIGAIIALLIDDWAHWKETGEGALKPVWEWLEKIGGQFKGLFSDIAAVIEKFDEWSGASEKIKDVWETIKTLFDKVLGVINKIISGIGGAFGALMVLAQGGSFSEAWDAFKASLEDDEPEIEDDEPEIKTVKGNITYSDKKLNPSSVELGQSYITQANATPLNQMTPTQMTMMNSNNQSQEERTTWNVGQVTINQKNNESAQQTMIDWTSQVNPAF